jgi:GAF domain-containing protein
LAPGPPPLFLATDVSQIPYFHANPLLPRTKAELAVPVQKGDRVLGVLDLQSEEVNGFSEQDLTLMQSIADQVAVALDNARLFQASQAAVAEVEALNARLTRQLWESAVQKVEQSAFVYANKTVSPAAGTWLPTMTEAVKHKDFVHRLYPAESESDPAASTLAVPLILRGQMIGVIGIERALEADILSVGSDETGSWSEDELITIRAVSEQIALALDSARLARDTERAAWRDRLVSEATARVWASSEIEAVMQAAIAQLGDKLGAAEVVIRLGTEDKLFEF